MKLKSNPAALLALVICTMNLSADPYETLYNIRCSTALEKKELKKSHKLI
jgi:hypothetical protein